MWTDQDLLGCPGLAYATVVVSAVSCTASPEEQPSDFWFGKALDVLATRGNGPAILSRTMQEPHLSPAWPLQCQNSVCQSERHSPTTARDARALSGTCRAGLAPACSP